MDTQTLTRLNRRLGDARGRNPRNEPVYRWVHSSELFYPDREGSAYVQRRQIEEDRWLVAMWQPPLPESQWKAQFPDIGYPAQGIYYATDQILLEGIEPNDTITEDVAGRIKAIGCMTFADCLRDIERQREARDATQKRIISDFVDDACCAFDHVPGRRGDHVSFGGIDADSTSNN